MNGPITWELIVLLVTFAGGVLGVWWRIERRIEKAEAAAAEALKELRRQVEVQNEARADEIMTVGKDLGDYKLHAAEQFASRDHLKEVEARLATAIDRLTLRIEVLPTKLAEEFARIMSRA